MNSITEKELAMAKSNSLNDINQFLNDYVSAVDKNFDLAAQDTAKEAAKVLKQVSPADTGSYAKGWTWKKVNGRYIVYNKTDYQLTHLLEYGHDVVAYGKKIGRAPAKPHIKQVEEWMGDYLIKKLEELNKNEH